MLKRRGAKLSRDVILMLNADEESGGRKGAQWMAEKHLEKIDAEFVLNEGGRINLKDGKIVQFAVQCAEKIYNDVRLWVRGTSGHSSVPRADNAIYNAAGMLLKLQGYETPIRVTEIARAYFAGIADLAAYAEHRELMKRLPDPKAAAELAARDPKFNAILRTTFVPTLVKGGIRVNVLPPDVEININVRLLPGDKIDELLRGLSRHLGLAETPILNAAEFEAWKKELEESLRAGKPASQVAWVKDLTDEDAPATPLDTAFLEAVRGAAKELAPEASVVPFMSTGATDSRFFRSRGRHAYGLMPLPVTDEEEKGFHGHDERVRLTSVTFGVRLLYEVVTRLAR
jgi:acetylornithine deacetylase/succinyl-diaminopimelate desuccinylase-like protein